MKSLLLSLLLIACSCGYRYEGQEEQQGRTQTTISVPYIPGDIMGQFNQELIRTLAASGSFECRSTGGQWLLNVVITDDGSDRIGYRYNIAPDTGQQQNNLIGVENRRSITARISLYDSATDQILIPETTFTASVDYDYQIPDAAPELIYFPTNQSTIEFSLGQLDTLEGGNDSSTPNVYRRLAQQVVSSLLNNLKE